MWKNGRTSFCNMVALYSQMHMNLLFLGNNLEISDDLHFFGLLQIQLQAKSNVVTLHIKMA